MLTLMSIKIKLKLNGVKGFFLNKNKKKGYKFNLQDLIRSLRCYKCFCFFFLGGVGSGVFIYKMYTYT